MSTVRVAVPVLQGRRKFHFDKGRPWTALEHIILTSLAQHDATAGELSRRGDVPHRVIVEALIRLMRAGWVQMVQRSGSISFTTTQEGLIAATADELPSASRRMSRKMTFVIDQVTGGVFRTRELPYLHTHMVEERAKREPIIWIERPTRLLLDGIRPLIAALFQDDERFVAMDSSGDRLADRWSLVVVRDGSVDGLTPRAAPELVAAIEAAARAAPSSGFNAPVYQAAPAPQLLRNMVPATHTISFQNDDVVLGGKEHFDAIRFMLRKTRHRMLIHSTFIAEDRFDKLMEDFKVAIGHGATIDVMWGQDENISGVRSTREAVARLRQRLSSAGIDQIRIHPFSTRSHCKMIVGDDGSLNRFTAYVGSCNWLSTQFSSFEASVRLRDSLIIADVVDQFAELSRGSNGHWTQLTGELGSLVAYLRTLQRAGTGRRAEASLILGGQHADRVRLARDDAEQRIFVTSHRFGVAAQAAVIIPALAAAHDRDVRTEVFYGTKSGPIGGAEVADITLSASEDGVRIRAMRKPRLHAKILAWDDDSVVITSQNWLSADPPDSNPRQEIGVYLRTGGVARSVVERFNAARIE